MSGVLLAGAFGQSNPGDEALLSAFQSALPGYDLVATSDDPAATERSHDLRAVDRNDPTAVARQMAATDAVVFAGGTIFKPLHPSSGRRRSSLLERALMLATGAKALRKPLALIGVGASTLDGRVTRGLARGIVARSDLLVVRDEESATALDEAGAATPVRVGSDASWTLIDPPEGGARQGQSVVVALSHLAGGERLAADLAAGLAPLVAHGVPVALQPWQQLDDGTDDIRLAEEVRRLLDDAVEVIPPPADIDSAIATFAATARVVVGLRFHSLVAAAAAGVPFVAVSHELKLAALARRLAQPAVAPSDLTSGLPSALSRAMNDPAPSPRAVRAEIDNADGAFGLLRVLLDGGQSPEAVTLDGLKLAPQEWLS